MRPIIPSQGRKEPGKSHSKGKMQPHKIYRQREVTVHTQIFRGEPYLSLVLGKRNVLEQTKVQQTQQGIQNECERMEIIPPSHTKKSLNKAIA